MSSISSRPRPPSLIDRRLPSRSSNFDAVGAAGNDTAVELLARPQGVLRYNPLREIHDRHGATNNLARFVQDGHAAVQDESAAAVEALNLQQ